jgi:hypothetical protein
MQRVSPFILCINLFLTIAHKASSSNLAPSHPPIMTKSAVPTVLPHANSIATFSRAWAASAAPSKAAVSQLAASLLPELLANLGGMAAPVAPRSRSEAANAAVKASRVVLPRSTHATEIAAIKTPNLVPCPQKVSQSWKSAASQVFLRQIWRMASLIPAMWSSAFLV